MNLRKFPKVLQEEVFECGLACIASIACYHGAKVNLKDLSRRYNISSSGLTLLHLKNIFSNFGIVSRGVKLDFSEIDELRLPAILLWNHHHYVVLIKITPTTVHIMDPAVGIRQFTRKEANEYFSGAALEIINVPENINQLTINDNDDESNQNKAEYTFTFREFIKSFRKYKSYIFPLLIFSIFIQIVNISTPKIVSLAMDEVLRKNDIDFLLLLLYIAGFLFALQTLASYLKNILALRFGVEVVTTHGAGVVRSILAMPLAYFSKRTPANILRKVRAVDSIKVAYTHGYVDITVNSLAFLAITCTMIAANPMLGSALFLSAASFLLFRYFSLERLKSLMFLSGEHESRRDMLILSSIRAIRAIKLRGQSAQIAGDWANEQANLEAVRTSLDRSIENLKVLSTAISSMQLMFLIGVGSLAVLKGNITAGTLISLFFYKTVLMENCNNIAMTFINLEIAKIETKRLKDVQPLQNFMPINYGYSDLPSGETSAWNSSEFKNVSFGYTNLDKPVLSNVNFRIDYGEKVSIRGVSGSGKSTFIDLLCGLHKPTTGEILVNEVSLSRYTLPIDKLGISLCKGDDEIIDGTLIENVLYKNPDLDINKLESAMKMAGVESMVPQLLYGVNTRLGTAGSSLSSGQRQRVFLARALYHDPRLLILDEPTSHLDDETANSIIESIRNLPISVLVITHDERVDYEVCSRRYIVSDGKFEETLKDKSAS